MTEVIVKCVPWTARKEDGRPKWYNREVKKAIKKKKEAWKRWKRTKREVDKEEYRRLEKETKGLKGGGRRD